MSGDIQARKRKEKKRKKDEEDNVTPPPTVGNVSENLADNISIHIYKESNTGGHWCARIIFFAVLAALVGLIGIVIVEHRGTTDISAPLESSRWAFIFDGWVDDSLSLTDEESHDNKDEEVVQIEEDEEKSNENEKERDSEGETSAEEEIQEEDEILMTYAEQEDEQVEDEKVESNEEQSQIFDNEEELSKEEEDREDSKQEEDTVEDEGNSPEDFDDTDVLEEIYGTSKDKTSDEEIAPYETDGQSDEIIEMSTNEDVFETFVDIPGVNEINDDNIEPLEEVENIEPDEYINDIDVKPEIEEVEEESASVAMKFGVGAALVVAAHFVLVKRWNNEGEEKTGREEVKEGKADKEEIGMLKEIVKVKKNQKKVEGQEKQVAKEREEEETEEEEEDGEEEVGNEEMISIEERDRHENNKRYHPKLKGSEEKEKSMTQSNEMEIAWKKVSQVGSEEEEEQEEEEEEEEEELGEEEEEEDEEEEDEIDEEEEEEEEEIEDFDDSELVAKLEAKYGKLQTIQNSGEEDSEHEKEIEPNNSIIRKPSVDIVTKFSTRKNNDQTNIEHVKNKNGTKVYNFNTSNAENVLVQEDVDYTDYKEFDN